MDMNFTIPVNEAFEASAADHSCGCPLCALYRKLEEDELELILGASMMEPDIRIKTNEKGFCRTHYEIQKEVIKTLDPIYLPEHKHSWNGLTDKPFYVEDKRIYEDYPKFMWGYAKLPDVRLKEGISYSVDVVNHDAGYSISLG